MDFFALHRQIRPLIIANVWDAMSARAAWQAGYSAIGTSSAAIAAMLGYSDGENMSFDELLFIVRRLKAVCPLPLTVDMETGYGRSTGQVIENLVSLATEGVVGVNLEDSVLRQS